MSDETTVSAIEVAGESDNDTVCAGRAAGVDAAAAQDGKLVVRGSAAVEAETFVVVVDVGVAVCEGREVRFGMLVVEARGDVLVLALEVM